MKNDRTYSTAIHILTTLAYHDPNLVSSELLAKGIRTNPGLIRRVLSKLSNSGLIISSRGKSGGSRLAKPANEIDLREVYAAVKEGPLIASFDKDPFKACPISCSMGSILNNIYDDLEFHLMGKMKEIKLSSILARVP